MNQVINANLGGQAFTFDDAAYTRLDDYLADVDGYFRGSPGHHDIMYDLEARLAELFGRHLGERRIVTESDVHAATATLGTPAQLAGASAEAPPPPPRRGAHAPVPQGYSRYGRRLLRDPDEKVVGGVCAGLSAYFGIENPAWLRIAFAIAVLAGVGTGLVVYVVLWAAMPKARTAADRLAMRGAPIDLEGISSQVEREVSQIGGRIQEWGDEVGRADWHAKWGEAREGWSRRARRTSASRGRRARGERVADDGEYLS